jgi:hypothetical protein
MSPPSITIPAPPPPPPPPPTISEARESRDAKDESLRRRKRGRAATVLTDQRPKSQVQPETASKTLLGS